MSSVRRTERGPARRPERQHFFASCSRGLEELLLAEVQALGIVDVRAGAAGVMFSGNLEAAYRVCLWSRIASRVLIAIGECRAPDARTLHAGVQDMAWERHVSPGSTIAVDFIGTSLELKNSLYSARLVKDGIVDRLRAVAGSRPDVDVRNPDVRIVARLHRDMLAVSIDLSGPQHERGYRGATGAAPLKENLAAAVLLRAGWPELAATGAALYDPLCGAGTLLIEAALMAVGAAPGELREVGTQLWPGHDPLLWRRLRDEARSARLAGMKRLPPIVGADADGRVLEHAQANLRTAGFVDIELVCTALASQHRPQALRDCDHGLLVCNPPYGERLGNVESLVPLYTQLGELVRTEFSGWRVAVLCMDGPLIDCIGLPFLRRYRLRNGSLDCRLLVHDPDRPARAKRPTEPVADQEAAAVQPELSAGAEMFANRLRKNLRRLKPWLNELQPECYRLYDADIPEYAVAVDRYRDWLHVAEYAPPASVDEALARARLDDVRAALVQVMEVPSARIALKTRTRQRGTKQYQRLAHENHFMEVREGTARLLVNLRDFLDTGLFLDHRPARRMVAEMARGQRFLNLFCYTATVSVFAALGGARETTGVDLSATYLDWARRNLDLNGLSSARHELFRADCQQWLGEQRRQWDLIFLDPPSFSNSKSMSGTLDVQRDHIELLHATMRVLAPGGSLLFSTNRRGFRLDREALGAFVVTDLSEQSIDPDFNRKPLPHRLYQLRHGG